MTPRAIVDSEIRIASAELTEEQAATLRAALSYPNPAYRVGSHRRRHDCRVSPYLTTLREIDDRFLIPRGATSVVRALGIGMRDQRLRLASVGFRFEGELRDYQRAAVAAALRAEQGVIVAPCGAGKTTIACGLIAQADQPALVLVNSRDLADQWCQRVRAHLGVEASRCEAGRIEIGAVTIATVQTVRKAFRLAELRDRFGLVLVDEAHHTPAATFADVVGSFPARYRFGVTATPSRADGLDVLLGHYLGLIIPCVDTSALVDAGHLVRPRYVIAPTRFAYRYAGPHDWQPMLEALVACPARNRFIVDTIAAECGGGIVGLALTGRVAHAEELRDLIAARGLRVVALTGSSSKTERRDALDRARCGDVDVITATQLADEGLDVPRLERVFLTFPSRSAARLLQRIGRVMRPHPEKGTPAVIDFVDGQVGVLRYQAKKRAHAFESLWRSQLGVAA